MLSSTPPDCNVSWSSFLRKGFSDSESSVHTLLYSDDGDKRSGKDDDDSDDGDKRSDKDDDDSDDGGSESDAASSLQHSSHSSSKPGAYFSCMDKILN